MNTNSEYKKSEVGGNPDRQHVRALYLNHF